MRSTCATHRRWLLLAFVASAVTAPAAASPVQRADADCLSAGLEARYPPLDASPIAQVLPDSRDSAAPPGAACFEKTSVAASWVTVASVIRTADSPNTVIGRFGAISELLTVQYWSTTEHKWRPLVSSASAILRAESAQRRGDYSAAELASGEPRYYRVTDTRSAHASTYRLRLREVEGGRVVVETSNAAAIKEWGVTLYAADGLDTWYFLNERSPGVWAYYSITRVLPASFLAAGHEKSYINRAVALYRHYMHLPTDTEPPAAP
jgi:hypothetical protein